jgi:predicted DNA-binding transcriptional regulator AlpA
MRDSQTTRQTHSAVLKRNRHMANRDIQSAPALPAILLSPKQAQHALCIGTTTLYKFCDEGKLTPIKFGSRCTRFRLSEIEALIDAQAAAGGAK